MATKLYNLAVKTGTYTDNNGNTKNTWDNIGSVWENETANGLSRYIRMKATFNPAGVDRKEGESEILISLFPPKRQ